MIYRMLYHGFILLLGCYLSLIAARNLQLKSEEVDDSNNNNSSSSSSNISLIINLKDSSEESNEKSQETVTDDLIFLAVKNHTHHNHHHHHHHHHQHQHNKDSSCQEEKSNEEDDNGDDDNNDAGDDGDDADVDVEEVEEEEEEQQIGTPIDMSVFVALIPRQEVQSIVSNYYRHDTEVQRVYAFLSSSHIISMKQDLMQLPEVQKFIGYLNAGGLDILKLMESLMQAIKPNPEDLTLDATENYDEVVETSSSKGQLNGLHGLVDSILDVMPQDLILATFFDKIETDIQFGKLVNSVGTPKFAKILNNLQNSEPLQKLILVFHLNGIYIDKIVESLKSYFFLSSF